MPTFIILGIIFQIFTYNKVAWCSTLTECIKSNANNNIFQDGLYQKEMKLHTHDHIHHTLNFYPYTTNKLRVHAYNYRSPFSSTYKSKMQLQNDSINMFHSFYTQPNKHKKNLSFIQLGVHNLLSEQIFNFGGGKRHLTNDKYAIGYNTFYHCPISKKSSSQPYSINVGVEYWLYNTLFMLNNYYNLDNIFDPETSLQKCDIHYPKSGHQLYIQTKFPHFFEFTGQIKLEQFIYKKKYKKIFNKKNSDYYLSLNLNYQPIPMLGFSINNIFVNKQYNNTICRVLIDYQFGTPIMEQMHYTNKKNKSILNNLDAIIQPFIPTIIPHHDYISINDHNHLSSLRHTHKITGYPGEIKIIKIDDNNDKYVRWDFESLENHGGNIVAITHNTYALYFPNYPIKQENNIFVSYITNNATQSHQEQKKQNIHIVVKDFSQKKLLNTNTQKKDMSIINVNTDSGINVTENTAEHTLICHDDDQHSSIKNNTSVSNVFFALQPQDDVYNTPTENDQNTIIEDKHIFLAPPPPPIPFPFLEKDSSEFIASSTLNDTLLLNRSASRKDQQTHSDEKNADNEEMHDIFFKSSKIDFNQSDDLSYRLFTHRQSKFASVGTTEHINKLENTIRERRKTKHLSDMEQIFVKLNLAQSSSSISEDYATDDSSDSFNSTNKEEQYH
ncbi:inverse autotransporter beta domain-containing protein [Blochmannia endosymbiont of Camponotus modoc]|uniref:inverse autotransporter beta domain-containing protein n=1 Tax=Blochmannia endosymbiont of Camponotus modoc TaxID=2945587 RepID=UPI00202444A9|nr:inverse autotransporter beta domain-containing protein [Blochmannia endosymbiont of Camponotus modoc]URJ26408.1 inverse autotransporter beta domain-containing protein [Blochmannia endosymbiont of Camponotus modoc]